jgi:hypothetical protein
LHLLDKKSKPPQKNNQLKNKLLGKKLQQLNKEHNQLHVIWLNYWLLVLHFQKHVKHKHKLRVQIKVQH